MDYYLQNEDNKMQKKNISKKLFHILTIVFFGMAIEGTQKSIQWRSGNNRLYSSAGEV